MATRAEQAKAEGQRTGAAKAAKKRASKKPPVRSKKRGHTQTKATVAREPRDAAGKATRKSTRRSANRAMAGASSDIHEEMQKTSPDARFRRARAKDQRVRGA